MDLLPFIVGGLVTGSIYGLAGVGLVLTYKTSGIFNFAHGSLSAVSAFVFYTLHVQHKMNWVLAAIISIVGVGIVLGYVMSLLGRRLASAPLVVRVLGTLGVLLVVQASIVLIYGTVETRTVPQYLPEGEFHIAGTTITTSDCVLFAFGLIASLGLYAWFKLARGGAEMRASVQDPNLLGLMGTNTDRVRRSSWVIGATFASASGVLVAPMLVQIDATTLNMLVVTAFGAAAIGSFSSLPLTYFGGLVVGLVGSICTKYLTDGISARLPSALPFIILFVVLLIAKRGKLAELIPEFGQERSSWRAPKGLILSGAVGLVVLFAFVPTFAGYRMAGWTTFLADILLFLSLGLLVRTSGQVSLCHAGFLAIGVAAFSQLTAQHGWPWFLGALVAGLIAVPIGAVLAIPAIRLSGLYLALASLGFGIVLQYVFYPEDYMFGSLGLGIAVPRPDMGWLDTQSDRGYYYFVLVIVVLAALVITWLNRSRLGRLLLAIGSSTQGLATNGASVNVTRVLVFCLSAFLAAFAGVLGGGVSGLATGDSYSAMLSLSFFALIVISLGREPWYAILAAAGIDLIPAYVQGPNVSDYLTLAFGVFAILYALDPERHHGVPLPVRRLIDKLFRRPTLAAEVGTEVNRPIGAATKSPLDAKRETEPGLLGEGLRVAGLTVRFGGLVAVDEVSLDAPLGRITGLIGPNGAGKTTTFNACSGLLRPTAGTVSLNGALISRRTAPQRARLGLGRTFQKMELFETMSVRDNVSLGRESGFASTNPWKHVYTSRRQRSEIEEATESALDLCGIRHLAERPVGALSTGQRRLVELARCVAGPYSMLLLDEPSSGLDADETAHLGAVVEHVVAQRGVGVLIVEHDMALVTTMCDYIYVLDFGRLVFDGTPAEVVGSPMVQAAYLGDEHFEDLDEFAKELT